MVLYKLKNIKRHQNGPTRDVFFFSIRGLKMFKAKVLLLKSPPASASGFCRTPGVGSWECPSDGTYLPDEEKCVVPGRCRAERGEVLDRWSLLKGQDVFLMIQIA